MIDLSPLFLSLKLAVVTTLVLSLIGMGVGYLFFRARNWQKVIIKALSSLPIVLPPSVLGYYLLVAFNPQSALALWTENWLGISLLFSFPGLVVGSVIYSFPFMVNPLISSLESFPTHLLEASYTLGKSKPYTFRKIVLPLIRPSLIVAMVMSFAHTMGEFGVILMIGGNIPGKTRVASIEIYNQVEMMNYQNANTYALILLIFSFLILLGVYIFQHRNLRLLV